MGRRGSLKSRSWPTARTTASVPASTQTSVSLATRSRMAAERVRRKIPCPTLPSLNGAKNTVPWFIVQNGPVREARFKKSNGDADGEVHDLFVITGRSDAPGCNIAQFDFLPAGNPLTGQGGNSNIIFRIPTPVFGAGLIEAIPDSAILANMQANASQKSGLGYFRARERTPKRKCEPQRERWDHYPFRMEGAEQIPSHVCGRGLQRRDGHLEPAFPARARRNAGLFIHPHSERHTQLHDYPHDHREFRTRRSSQISKRLPTSCGCWRRPLPLPPRLLPKMAATLLPR